MCKKSKTESTVKLPAHVEAAGKDVYSRAQGFADAPVAPFTDDQQTAFQRIRDLVTSAPNVLPEALEGARTFRDAPAFELSADSAMTRYFNPFTEAALDPAIRKIMEAADASRRRIGAGAHMAGAFGDARHGVAENELEALTQRAIGDTSVSFFRDAFDKAMGLEAQRGGFEEAALGRGLTGSGALLDFTGKNNSTMLQALEALLGSGTIQQTDETRQQTDRLNMLMQALSAMSGTAPKTSVQTAPDNSGLGLLGSILAAPFTGGASLALAPLSKIGTGGIPIPGVNPFIA